MLTCEEVIKYLNSINWYDKKLLPSIGMLKFRLAISKDEFIILISNLTESLIKREYFGSTPDILSEIKLAQDKIAIAYLGDNPNTWLFKLDIRKRLSEITCVIEKALKELEPLAMGNSRGQTPQL